MTPLPVDGKRRRDVKTTDREKSMSPLDKDALKQRCLERLRSERRRRLERNRGRQCSPPNDLTNFAAALTTGSDGSHGIRGTSFSLSTPRQILHHELQDMSESRRRRTRPWNSTTLHNPEGGVTTALAGLAACTQQESLSMELIEENAYRGAFADIDRRESIDALPKVPSFEGVSSKGGAGIRLDPFPQIQLVVMSSLPARLQAIVMRAEISLSSSLHPSNPREGDLFLPYSCVL